MSDLDEEELKATREMKAINKIISPEEKSADEMLEELGYRKVQETNKFAMYVNKLDLEICFYKNSKSIGINTDTGETVFGEKIYGCTDITLQELQAINKKCKELRVVIMVKYYIKIIGIWIRVPKKIFFSRIAGYFYCMQKGEWLDGQRKDNKNV